MLRKFSGRKERRNKKWGSGSKRETGEKTKMFIKESGGRGEKGINKIGWKKKTGSGT